MNRKYEYRVYVDLQYQCTVSKRQVLVIIRDLLKVDKRVRLTVIEHDVLSDSDFPYFINLGGLAYFQAFKEKERERNMTRKLKK